jgi:hypothetical protein
VLIFDPAGQTIAPGACRRSGAGDASWLHPRNAVEATDEAAISEAIDFSSGTGRHRPASVGPERLISRFPT